MKKNLSLLCLGLMLLTGCMTRMEHETPDAQAAVQQIVDTIVSGHRSHLAEMVSLPFWMDHWQTNIQTVQDKLGRDQSAEKPRARKLKMRLYPLEDLAVLRPKMWEQVKQAKSEWLQDVWVAAIALEIDGQVESGLLLVRKVNGTWKMAGLLEE